MILSKRLGVVIALVILIIFAPFWIYLPALFLALVYFPIFWEGVILGFLADALYAPAGSLLGSHAIALASLIVALAVIPLRERFRFN
jgi:hypothetical protein